MLSSRGLARTVLTQEDLRKKKKIRILSSRPFCECKMREPVAPGGSPQLSQHSYPIAVTQPTAKPKGTKPRDKFCMIYSTVPGLKPMLPHFNICKPNMTPSQEGRGYFPHCPLIPTLLRSGMLFSHLRALMLLQPHN